jgi:hypothetical protein
MARHLARAFIGHVKLNNNHHVTGKDMCVGFAFLRRIKKVSGCKPAIVQVLWGSFFMLVEEKGSTRTRPCRE